MSVRLSVKSDAMRPQLDGTSPTRPWFADRSTNIHAGAANGLMFTKLPTCPPSKSPTAGGSDPTNLALSRNEIVRAALSDISWGGTLPVTPVESTTSVCDKHYPMNETGGMGRFSVRVLGPAKPGAHTSMSTHAGDIF